MTTFAPTPQQRAAEDALRRREDVLIAAGAGAGKTSTLVHLARVCRELGLYGAYICFNGSTAQEARGRFPSNFTCGTAHSFATQASRVNGGRPFWHHRLRSKQNKRGFQNARVVADILGITDDLEVAGEHLEPTEVATLAVRTVQAFCGTADESMTAEHVPLPDYLEENVRGPLAAALLPHAQRAWRDMELRDGLAGREHGTPASADSCLNVDHAFYLKRWQLSGLPIMVKGPGGVEQPADVVFFDECQDASPVMAAIFERMRTQYGKQLVLVGDQCQAINGFAGAIDIMPRFAYATRVELTKSFRFGPAVADEANVWLSLLDADLRITGHDPVESVVAPLGPDEVPDAILCRTSAGAMRAVLEQHAAERKVHLVGDGDDIKRLAQAAIDLDEKGWTGHPDLRGKFRSWQQVVDYCESGELGSEDLETGVRLIKDFTPEGVIEAIEKLVSANAAEVTVSTAHVSKGLEWDVVKIGDDFRGPKLDKNGVEVLPERDELMLAYVAVTRAKLRLDVGSLSWGRAYAGAPAPRPAPEPVRERVELPAAAPAPEPEGAAPATGVGRGAAVLRAWLESEEDGAPLTAEVLEGVVRDVVAAYLDQGVRRPELRVVASAG
jgi:hypothetical protein